ncbi:MAG TPA: C45 family peptidase [Gammaproteobacteria bacterium]
MKMPDVGAIRSTKIRHLSAAGDPFAIGRTLGGVAAEALHEIVPGIGRFKALASSKVARRAAAALEAVGRSTFPGFMREIDGIAAGAGVPFEDVWLWNCRGDIAGGGDQSGVELAGCTTVMLPATEVAPAVIGHNEDDQRELDGHCFIARIEPDDGPAFTSFYSPGLLPGHTFAVNDEGLVQTINHIRPHDQRVGVPRHLIARAILAQSSLDDAIALLSRGDRASGFHHNLGLCGDDRLLSVEAPATGCSVVPLEQAPNAHSNHLIHPQFKDIDQQIAESSRHRLTRANALISNGGLASRDPLVVLTDQGNDGLPIYRKGRCVDDPGYTLATAIFELGREQVAWRVYADSDTDPDFVQILATC